MKSDKENSNNEGSTAGNSGSVEDPDYKSTPGNIPKNQVIVTFFTPFEGVEWNVMNFAYCTTTGSVPGQVGTVNFHFPWQHAFIAVAWN